VRHLALDLPKPVSKIGLGTWQFGSREWGYGKRYAAVEAARIVERALELGITLFDTAEIYGLGRSERILGRALQARGNEVFVATKIFPLLPLAPVVEQRAVASAQRLGLRHLDLYQVHQPNPLVRDRTTMRGMRALQDVGLVGGVGVSNYSLERWRRAEGALGRPVLSNQVRYSLVDRRPERELIPYAEGVGRVVIAYSPLAQGFLSGRYNASTRPSDLMRRRSKLFRPDTLERGAALFASLREVASAHDATPAQVALAWAIRRPNVVAIPGASSVEQVESNAAAADLDLHDDEIRALSDAATAVTSIGG
jgi:aryl-alcohol dehydrogenase-like predicted oxidoreductase